jgi:hypothetical protein
MSMDKATAEKMVDAHQEAVWGWDGHARGSSQVISAREALIKALTAQVTTDNGETVKE